MLLNILTVGSAFTFIYYGINFFANSGMAGEFERYRLDRFRRSIGCLQLLGGLGLLVGFVWRPALILASGGLALLMLIGFSIRVKMKDGFWQSLPAFVFMLINGYILFVALFHFSAKW